MKKPKMGPPTVDILKGAALAMAQATLQNAMDEAGIDIAEVGRRMNYSGGAHWLMYGDSQMNIKRFAGSPTPSPSVDFRRRSVTKRSPRDGLWTPSRSTARTSGRWGR